MNNKDTQLENILDEEKSLQQRGRFHWWHWLIISLSLLLTLGAWYFTKVQVEEKAELQFERQVEHIVELVQERMGNYEDALWSGVAAIRSQTHGMDYVEWKRFSETLRIEARHPGINGIGVIFHVSPENLQEYLTEERKLRPNYKIHPAHDQKEYLPITYIEPIATNMKAVGLDMAHEENRYRAALKSRDTGVSQITAPITLVQDAEKTPGFLFYVPFYERAFPESIKERQEQFSGLVYAPFITKKLMAGVLETERRQVALKITDEDTVLYDEHIEEGHIHEDKPLFAKQVSIDLYGRTWVLEMQTKLSFREANKNNQPKVILAGGFIIDILLFSIFLLFARSNKKALVFGRKMTDSYKAQIKNIQKAEKEILRSNIELEKFAYLASHDLQEPLRMVTSFTEIFKEEYSDKFDDQAVFYMDHIMDASRRMQALVRDLLEYSKVQETDIAFKDINSEDCIEEALQNLKQIISETNANIIFDHMPVVRANHMHLVRLFQNLIGNAIKYKDQNSIPKIYVSAEENESEWVFSVADNGIGIKEEHLDKIFVLFKRLHNKDDYSGTGIGLAICEKIVECFNGRIWVTSEVGMGSIFYFSLPKEKGQ